MAIINTDEKKFLHRLVSDELDRYDNGKKLSEAKLQHLYKLQYKLGRMTVVMEEKPNHWHSFREEDDYD